MTKVMVNGYWAGCIFDPIECVEKIKLYRRNSLLSIEVSVTFDIKLNTIFIYNDSGRLCRPIFYLENGKDGFKFNKEMLEVIKDGSWEDLVTGFNKRKSTTSIGDTRTFMNSMNSTKMWRKNLIQIS